MKDLFIKKAMGILAVACHDADNPTCRGDIPFPLAVNRMLQGLVPLGKEMKAHGHLSTPVVSHLINFGGLALAAIVEPDNRAFYDITRDVQRRLIEQGVWVEEGALLDWLKLDHESGAFAYLATKVLEAKAIADIRAAEDAPLVGPDPQRICYAILRLVISWFYIVAVSLGEEDPLDGVLVAFPGRPTEPAPQA